ncbi:MAG: hypothetical protein P4M07_23040 [Xanthobacteraceae bacterium]|nr:hypothetical protein [Xanthobacteraceae bacterium]
MTAISAPAPSIGETIAQLIAGASGGLPTSVATNTNSASSSATTSSDGAGPATFVTLSDQAKAATAAKAQSDQAAADRLQAYVEAHRVSGTPGGADASTQPADAQATTSGAKVEAIVAQIKTLANANDPQPFQTFTPTKSLSNSVTYDGYTLTLDTNAGTQYYGIELSGNGVQAYSKHFGPSDGAGGVNASPPGVAISSGIPGSNNEAEDAITITRNVATASSASVSSSSAGSASTSSVNAQSSSLSFLVNYATGQISVEQSAAAVSAQATQISPPGSTLSTLA